VQNALKKIEGKIFNKFVALRDANVITKAEYKEALQQYNDFVLYLTIYRYHKTTSSKFKALAALKSWLQTYRLSVPFVPTPLDDEEVAQEVPPATPSVEAPAIDAPAIKTIGDIYTLPKALKFGDRGDDVVTLQNILKQFGYMKYTRSTGYYGDITATNLAKLSKEILHMDNEKGVLSDEIRKAILALPLPQ